MRALTFAAGSALLIAALLLCSVRADPQAKKELRDEGTWLSAAELASIHLELQARRLGLIAIHEDELKNWKAR
ncbi:MAG: hypothetical protein KDB03_16265 [Planctomycetales bacterium]|nr:hypothetical protein [Planctomycetales bacterium]